MRRHESGRKAGSPEPDIVPGGPPGLLFRAGVSAAAFLSGLGIALVLLAVAYFRRDPDLPAILRIPVAMTGIGLSALAALGTHGGWRRVGASFRSGPTLPLEGTPLGEEPAWLRLVAVFVALGVLTIGVWLRGASRERGNELIGLGVVLAGALVVAAVRARSRR